MDIAQTPPVVWTAEHETLMKAAYRSLLDRKADRISPLPILYEMSMMDPAVAHGLDVQQVQKPVREFLRQLSDDNMKQQSTLPPGWTAEQVTLFDNTYQSMLDRDTKITAGSIFDEMAMSSSAAVDGLTMYKVIKHFKNFKRWQLSADGIKQQPTAAVTAATAAAAVTTVAKPSPTWTPEQLILFKASCKSLLDNGSKLTATPILRQMTWKNHEVADDLTVRDVRHQLDKFLRQVSNTIQPVPKSSNSKQLVPES